MFDTVTSDVLNPILQKHGYTKEKFNPEGWYPLQILYDIIAEATRQGGRDIEMAVGKSIAKSMIEFLGVHDLTTFFEHDMDRLSRHAIRNVPAEFGYHATRLGPQHYHIKFNVPSPDNTSYGWVWETVRLLKKPTDSFEIKPGKGFGTSRNPTDIEVRWG